MKHRRKIFAIVVVTACCMFLGCATSRPVSRPVSLHSTQVEIFDAEKKKYFVVKEVPLGSVAEVQASFIWDYPGDAGVHTFRWNVYQGDKVLRAGKSYRVLFKSSPFIVLLKLDSAAFGIGDYRCVLFLDYAEKATVLLRIVDRTP